MYHFILAFPCQIECIPVDSVRELLFDGQESLTYNEKVYCTHGIAEYIQSSVKRVSLETMVDLVTTGYIEGMPKGKIDYTALEIMRLYDERRTYGIKRLERFQNENKKRYFYQIILDDKNEYQSVILNGDVFRSIPYVKVKK